MNRIIRPNAGLIIPQRRFVDVGLRHAPVTSEGYFRLRKFKAAGVGRDGVVDPLAITGDTGWFHNLILDSGLNRLGTGSAIDGAAIGTGSAPPEVTQTGLQTVSHYTTTAGTGNGTATAAGAPPYNNSRLHVYRTALGALNGVYTEVGVGWGASAMFARSLILDGSGNPTSISVASDEQLDISYLLYVYPPLDDIVSVVTISGVDYTVTGRAASVNNTSSTTGWGARASGNPTLSNISSNYLLGSTLGPITGSTSGSASGSGSVSTDPYINNSLQRTANATWGLNAGNVSGGVGAAPAGWTNFGSFQYGFSPTIPKDGTKTLVLNFSINWARRP